MRVSSHQGRTAVPEQAGKRALCHSRDGQPAGKRVPLRVHRDARQSQLVHRRLIVPTVEVPWVRMGLRILAWKHAH